MPPIIKKPTPRYTASDSSKAKIMVDIRKKRMSDAQDMIDSKIPYSDRHSPSQPSRSADLRNARKNVVADTTLNTALKQAHGNDASNDDLDYAKRKIQSNMKIRKKK